MPWKLNRNIIMSDFSTKLKTILLQSLFITLLLFVAACSPKESFAAVHPNLYLNQSEIYEIKSHIASDQGPWKSAYSDFISQADQDLSLPPGSVTDNGGGHVWETDQPYTSDGIYDPNADRQDYILGDKISDAILDLGLAYQLTGKPEYADKAIQLIEVWFLDKDTALQAGTGSGNEIEMWITMPAAFYGMDLLWNYPSFPEEDKRALQLWAQVTINRLRNLRLVNNWENWRLVYLMSLAHIADDKGAMDSAIARWKEVAEYQIDGDGLMSTELNRTLSLDYSIFALSPMAQGAEIARHYGVDLYGYRNSHDQGLETVFDTYVPYLLNDSSWPYQQIRPFDTTNGIFVYELAYSRYGHKDTYKSVINKYQRPMVDTRTMGHATLTHGSSFDDPLPAPTPLP